MNGGKVRYNISLTPEIQQELEALEHNQFQNMSRGEMFRTLIQLGLNSVHEDKEALGEHSKGE